MDSTYPLVLSWVWGHNTSVPPINLSTPTEKSMYFAAGPVGVCYDWPSNKQKFLFGHKNNIVAIASTKDKKFIATADAGEGNIVIIWQIEKRSMYHVIYSFSPDGVVSLCFSSDGSNLFALSGQRPQELTIWDWRHKTQIPAFKHKFDASSEFQIYLVVHPVRESHFVTNGKKSVYFFKNEGNIHSACLDITNLYDEKTAKKVGSFTQTAFSPLSSLAVTATNKGYIVLWGRPLYVTNKPAVNSKEWFVLEPSHRVCIRTIQTMENRCSIPFLSSTEDFIIAGTGDSRLLFYDEDFAVQWYMGIHSFMSKEFSGGQVNNISFTYKLKKGLKGLVKRALGKEMISPDNPLEENDFIVSTSEGFVGFHAASTQKVTQLLWGTNHLIKSVAVHPLWPYIYFGDYNGCLQKWNFKTKKLMKKELYEGPCSEIEHITVDDKGAYVACAMSNGLIVIFDAIYFSAKPFFTADEVIHKPIMMHFAPDSQYLLIIDGSSYVTLYRLQLLVSLKVLQMLKKDSTPSEQPFWSFGGKTRQHQGRIVDCIFSDPEKTKNLLFYTLAEDRYLVEYNITASKGIDIEVSKRIILDKKPIPMCMMWFPLFDVNSLLGVLNDDNKMRLYDLMTEKLVRIISLPDYGELCKKVFLKSKKKCLLAKEFPDCTDPEEVYQYIVFCCPHIVGLSKYPFDGNPNTSLGVESTPSGINTIKLSADQSYLFSSGSQDSWIFMYEMNIKALLEAEKEGGDGIDSFKYLFPSNCDPDEMTKRLKCSVYALELEKKMLELGVGEQPYLTGEIPCSFLEYVLAAIGCFTTRSDLQMMFHDIEFENQYKYNGTKTTLNCLDIIKLYVNYRPKTPVTVPELRSAFRHLLSVEEDPDQMPRTRMIDILSTRGDALHPSELVEILECLQNRSSDPKDDSKDSSDDKAHQKDEEEPAHLSTIDHEAETKLKRLIPEFITEDILFQEILCLEQAEEDLSQYVLTKDDYKVVQEYPSLDDFVAACKEIGF